MAIQDPGIDQWSVDGHFSNSLHRSDYAALMCPGAFLYPDGYGLFDELFELLTSQQAGIKRSLPTVLFGPERWTKLLNFD